MIRSIRRAIGTALRSARLSGEADYRFVAERLGEFVIVTRDGGVVHFTSDALNASFGYAAHELHGATWPELVAPADAPAVSAALAQAGTGRPARVVCRLAARDGGMRWVECHFGAVTPPGDEVVAVCYDLGRLVAAEEELAVARAGAHGGGAPELLELGGFVNGLVPWFRAAAPEGVLVLVGSRDLAWVWDDPERLRNGLQALVERACAGLLLGGTVRVGVGTLRARRGIVAAHQSLPPGTYARLSLVLEGYGIALRAVEGLVGDGADGGGDPAHPGFAAWLAAAGGGARVERRPGHDPVVSVFLPLSRVASASAMPQPRTILVAGADAALRGVAGRILELEGYQVLHAANAREAAQMVASAEVVVAGRPGPGEEPVPLGASGPPVVWVEKPGVPPGGAGWPLTTRSPINPAELVRAVERAAASARS